MEIKPTKIYRYNLPKSDGFVLTLSSTNDMRYGIQIRKEHLKEIVDAAKAGKFDYWLEGDWNSTTEANIE